MKAIKSNEKLTIGDLGKTLYPGQTLWLEEEEYESSICLKTFQKMGKVQVMSAERHKKLKERIETSNRANRAARKYRSPPHQSKVQPPKPVPGMVTEEQAQDMVNKAASGAAAQAIAAMTAQMQNFIAQSTVGEARPGIEQIVQQAVSQALQSAQITRPFSAALSGSGDVLIVNGPEEPLFIPTGIVKQDSEDLSINTTSSKDENIDDAVAALKALKKK